MTSPKSCRVEVIPDGPAVIRGADVVADSEGQEHPVTRPVVAVCLCGNTQRDPWCDGTHKAVLHAARQADDAAHRRWADDQNLAKDDE